MQFLQTVCTAFSNAFGVSAFVGLFSTTFYQTFLFQAITATFSNAFGVSAFVGLFSAAFYQAFLFQAVTTVFSYSAFGVVAVFVFLRTAAGQGLARLNGLSFVLWGGLFSGWEGKCARSQDRQLNSSEYLAFHDGLLRGRARECVLG